MKLKITLLFFCVYSIAFAQKQIQPYTFTNTDDKDITRTIIISASPKTVNSVKFTLKNDKGEPIKTSDNKDIVFEVFPFTEVVFRNKLKKAISEDIPKDNDLYKIIKFDPKKRGDYVKEVRNIFQFFNALITTAFQYDTEPIAGTLKYSLNTTITKKNIEGIDADKFFKRIRKRLKSNRKIYKREKFISYVIKKETRIKLKTFTNSNLETKLKKLYVVWKLEELLLSEKLKTKIDAINVKIDTIKIKKSKLKLDSTYISKELMFNNSIKLLDESIEKLKKDEYEDDFFDRYAKPKSKILESENSIEINENKINDFVKEQDTILKKKNDLEKYIDSVKIQIKSLKDIIKQNESFFKDRNNSLTDREISKKANPSIEKNINLREENIKTKKESIALMDSILNKRHTSVLDLKGIIKKAEGVKKKKQSEINFFIAAHKNKIKSLPLYQFKIDDIQLDINDGFIEHITVVGKVTLPVISQNLIWKNKKYQNLDSSFSKGLKTLLEYFYREDLVKEILNNIIDKELKFVNQFPFGFSSKSDFDDLYRYNLYHSEGKEKMFSMPITNVITAYIQKHQNNRLNFSPKNQIVSLPTDDIDKNLTIELKKEISSKILNATIFSDFLGFKEGNPNGLIQVEVEKNIPIWTKRFILGAGRSSNLGIFNYANFNLTWARIEDKSKELQVKYLDRYINNVYSPEKYVSYLDLIKHESISVGVDLNLLSVDMPTLKGRIEINAGIHYGRVKVVDTLKNSAGTALTTFLDKEVNIIRAYPDFIYRIRPEERFGGYLRFRPYKVIIPNNNEFQSLSSPKSFIDTNNSIKKKEWLHRFEFSGFYTPSAESDNKFFFRYRYTNTSSWETNGFSEFQVGYLAYLKF